MPSEQLEAEQSLLGKDTPKSKKTLVLDTNIFLGVGTEPFNQIKDADIVIPMVVLKEISKFVSDAKLGFMARETLRFVENLRLKYGERLKEGVPFSDDSAATLAIEINNTNASILPPSLNDGSNDSIILSVAQNLKNSGKNVTLVTNDLPLRIAASIVLKLDSQAYKTHDIEPFSGRYYIDLSEGCEGVGAVATGGEGVGAGESVSGSGAGAADGAGEGVVPGVPEGVKAGAGESQNATKMQTISSISDDEISLKISDTLSCDGLDNTRIAQNAFVTLKQGEKKHILYKKSDAYFEPDWEIRAASIRGKNVEQKLAFNLLCDDDLQVVTLGGVAGAGKTLLSLAAGLSKVKQGIYQKITVFRSMYAVDNQSVGFLPGDISEKIDPWTQPIWDCIEKIETSAKGGGKNGVSQNRLTIIKKYESIIDIQPITFIRGRTLNNQYVIIDDAQSLDKGVLLDIFSRLGEDTKMVCTFDLSQNDNKFISRQSSILSLIDRLKTEPCFAHMDFVKSERSSLAQLAAKILEEN